MANTITSTPLGVGHLCWPG